MSQALARAFSYAYIPREIANRQGSDAGLVNLSMIILTDFTTISFFTCRPYFYIKPIIAGHFENMAKLAMTCEAY